MAIVATNNGSMEDSILLRQPDVNIYPTSFKQKVKKKKRKKWSVPVTVTINANCGSLGSTTTLDRNTSPATAPQPPGTGLSTKLEESLSENVASLLDRLSIDSLDANEDVAETLDYCFVFKDDNHLVSCWSGSVLKDNLYIEFPDGKMPVGSRECFVMLLDYAEEKLEVSSVILCLPKHQVEEAEILRAFMYLGFEVVHNSTCKLVPPSDTFVFMAYGFE